MNEFDIKAANWDQEKMHIERAESVAEGIREMIPLTVRMKALEFGSGTGITSFFLKDSLGEITLMDSSMEMLKVAEGKIIQSGALNLRTLLWDLAGNRFTDDSFDLVFCQLVIHHITDITDIISKFKYMLNSGGYLAIADLYPEDGSFHGKGFAGHRGFDPEELAGLLKKAGFEPAEFRKIYTINKKISDSVIKPFDLFLLVARSSQDQRY
jgi:ubiquinone/menaquinone biosynthesis C-methylase UbiE